MNSKEPLRFFIPMLKTPGMLKRAVRGVFTKHILAKREYKRGDGISRIPIHQISLKIVNACNLRCKTCGQWGETGYNIGKPSSELSKIVPVERYLDMADRVKKHKPIYYIWGGEPFLYPGLFELTDRIKKNGSLLSVVTNGTFTESKAEEIVRQGWDALMFSLDGPEDIHDEIRGKKGTFKKVKAGIDKVQYYKKEMKKTVPWIMPLITVSTWNAHKLDEIFEVARELGTDCIVVYYSWFTDENIGNLHTRVMEKKLDITPTSWKGYLFDHNVDTEALKDSLARIRKKKWNMPRIFIPDLKEDQLAEYYSDPGNFFGYGPCISPWMTVEVMPNGDVSPCRDYPDFVTGNLMEQTLEEIWNGDKYVRFRKALYGSGGTFPICSRCCGLMGW